MIYITGDTHGDLNDFRNRMQNLNLTREDIVIVCGDFGFNWDAKHISDWKRFERPYTVLFCDGNHENYDVLNNLRRRKMFGDEVCEFDKNTFRLLTGHMYDIEGVKTFVFGGATSIDRQWRLENEVAYGKLWWKEEVPTQETFEEAKKTLKKHNWTFDLFLSHTCRPELKEKVLDTYKKDFYDPVEDMIRALEEEIERHGGSWKKSCFGHFHMDKEYGKYCCLYEGILRWIKKDFERAGQNNTVEQRSVRYYDREAAKRILAELERARVQKK